MLDRLDFKEFYSPDTSERNGFCRRLVSSLKQKGFVRLVNHGVPPQDIDKAFLEVRFWLSTMGAGYGIQTDLVVVEQTQQFFQLPLEEKLKSPHPPTPNPHRGYSAFGVEVVATHSNFESKTPMPLLKDMKVSLSQSLLIQAPTNRLPESRRLTFVARSRMILDLSEMSYTAIFGRLKGSKTVSNLSSRHSSPLAIKPNAPSSRLFPLALDCLHRL